MVGCIVFFNNGSCGDEAQVGAEIFDVGGCADCFGVGLFAGWESLILGVFVMGDVYGGNGVEGDRAEGSVFFVEGLMVTAAGPVCCCGLCIAVHDVRRICFTAVLVPILWV